MPSEIRDAAGESIAEIRQIFLSPDVDENVTIEFGKPDFAGVVKFLCDEREFSRERVQSALDRAWGGAQGGLGF